MRKLGVTGEHGSSVFDSGLEHLTGNTMSSRKMKLPRAVLVVLAARPEGLTLEQLKSELQDLKKRGIVKDDITDKALSELLELGLATRVIVNGNGRFKLNIGVRRDKYYWGIITREVEDVYGHKASREQ